MPGRQHTEPVSRKYIRSRKESQKGALNALATAEQQVPDDFRIRKGRLGDLEQGHFKRRREDSDYESDPGQDRGQRSKRARAGEHDKYGNEIEVGSDSEGNEWMTGKVDSEDDSSIDSDEAMGESDEERFEGFKFRGSSGKNATRVSRWPRDAAVSGEIDLDEDAENGLGVDSGEESEEFAAEAVDLATALEDSEKESAADRSARRTESQGSARSDWEEGSSSSDDDQESTLSLSDAEDEMNDPKKLFALQELAVSMGNGKNAQVDSTEAQFDRAQEAKKPSEFGITTRRKLTVEDLLPALTDSKARKSLRLMADDGKKSVGLGKGVPGKLEVPLAKRQQDRLDHAAAYDQSKETLNRWIDTVKHNRRAEHLIFPLPDQDVASAMSTRRLRPTTNSKPMTDLESTIRSILLESGLVSASGRSEEEHIQEFEELATNKMPIEEVQARRAELRRNRELLFREEIRARRIKKIKSKSYRRVHRKERQRNALRDKEALVAAGIEPSEDEQERLDRLRAEERMGARHRESRWAKSVKSIGRAAWDEDARSGVNEMAKREEELRRRIEGKEIRDEDSLSGSESSTGALSDEEDEDAFKGKLKEKLGKLKDDSIENPRSGLSSLKFMQKADAARKAQNDETIEEMRRQLAGEDSVEDEDQEVEEPGRRQYGPRKIQSPPEKPNKEPLRDFEERHEPDDDDDDDEKQDPSEEDENVEIIVNKDQKQTKDKQVESLVSREERKESKTEHHDPLENPWLSRPKRNPKTKRSPADNSVLISTIPESPPLEKPQSFRTSQESKTVPSDAERSPAHSSPEPTSNQPASTDPPTATTTLDPDKHSDASSFRSFSSSPEPESLITNQSLIRRAFASDSILTTNTFAAEKSALAASERSPSPSASSTALPGWGSWTGVGLSKRDKRKPPPREDSSKNDSAKTNRQEKQRKDAALSHVIVSEKRVPKTARYLATQLPHPFETRAQYERSLRVPVGPEFTTKAVFQDMTKPRVLKKGGVIAPMRKPIV